MFYDTITDISMNAHGIHFRPPEYVIRIKQYYKTEEEFNRFYLKLKFSSCPYCHVSGYLILHGYLYGYSEQSDFEKIRRGRRIFCSNRNRKSGCGKTYSILIAGFIKNFMITAVTVWSFLDQWMRGMSLSEAFRRSGSKMAQSCVYRIFNRFKKSQSHIRTLLKRIKDPPHMPYTKDPTVLTLFHLRAVFNKSICPISSFQHYFQVSFL